MRTGVYFCETGERDCIDRQAVLDYTSSLPDVVLVTDLGALPKPDPEVLAAGIKREDLTRVVIAGDAPGFFKQAFTHAMALAGRDTYEVHLASFREHCADSGMGTIRAKSIVACATMAVPFRLAAVPDTSPVDPNTLVIGAGIAGIQAALEIADAGKQVFLVERTGTIGGHMAMFDKTFPTLDCAACILTPKMVAVGQHDHDRTHDQQRDRGGRRRARRVQGRSCARRRGESSRRTASPATSVREVCPVRVVSDFDNGIAERKAAYIPFPQAVPNAYLIDAAACTWVQSDGTKCGVCVKKCPKDCIDLDQADELVEFTVGNIVLATGYDLYDAHRVERYGYGKLPNVLIVARVRAPHQRLRSDRAARSSPSPCSYNKRKKADEWVFDAENGTPPESVAIIHCVGSRDASHNDYCSRVCCMYSLKFAHLVREKLPDADCYEFYIDMRAFGKGYEEFAERIKAEGTHIVRGRTAKVVEEDGQHGHQGRGHRQRAHDRYSRRHGGPGRSASCPLQGSNELAELLKIDTDRYGWFSELDYNSDPTDTERGGIFVAGVCQGPKDIPDTVAQASAVAAGVLKSIAIGRGVDSDAELPLERHRSAGRAPRSGSKEALDGDTSQPQVDTKSSRSTAAEDVNKCYHCGNCSAVCPFSEEPYIIPRRAMRSLQMGLEEKLESDLEPWLCYYCGECSEECPRGAEPGETMMSLRRWLTARYDFTGISHLFYRRGSSSCSPSSSWPLSLAPPSSRSASRRATSMSTAGENAFLPASKVHIFDWALAGFLLSLLVINCTRMWWFTVGRDKSHPISAGATYARPTCCRCTSSPRDATASATKAPVGPSPGADAELHDDADPDHVLPRRDGRRTRHRLEGPCFRASGHGRPSRRPPSSRCVAGS